MCVVWRALFVACRLLFGNRCLLCSVVCLLFVCSMVFVGRCLLFVFVVCCLMIVAC